MNRPWFRMHAEAVDDEKLRLLAFEDRWHFVALLCLKAQGTLDSDAPRMEQRIALKLGLQLPQLDELKRRLMEIRLIDETFQPVSWGKRQYESDTSTERVRKHRAEIAAAKQAAENKGGTTPKRRGNVSVTPSEQSRAEQNRADQSPSAASPPSDSRGTLVVTNDWFLNFKLTYPERAGDYGWAKARRAANARIAEGHTPEEFLAGAKRYAAYCVATEKAGTEYVKQAATFLGPDKPFLLPWVPPPGKNQQRQDANIAASREWLEKSNAA